MAFIATDSVRCSVMTSGISCGSIRNASPTRAIPDISGSLRSVKRMSNMRARSASNASLADGYPTDS
jgi:hypothetical protein